MRCGACCARAGTSTADKSRNIAVWLRIVSDPIKLPVLLDRLQVLPELGAVRQPADQVVEARDGYHGDSVTLLYLLDRRELPSAALHPVEGDYHPGRGGAV